MSKKPNKPPGRIRSSIVARLNTRLILRLLGIYLCMDLLLLALCAGGIFLWADRQSGEIAKLVDQRGVPSAEATEWMAAGDYTVAALDSIPDETGFQLDGVHFGFVAFGDDALQDSLRTVELGDDPLFFGPWRSHPGRGVTYTVSVPNDGQPYAITLDLESQVTLAVFAGRVLLICQAVSLFCNLFKNAGTIRKTLRPIQELAAAAAKLGSSSTMSPEELSALADKLGDINATHLDARISVPGAQKELKTLAQAINAMLDRINDAYRSQMRFVSDASHELRTPIAVIQGYANLLDRWGKDDPTTRQEAIDAIRAEADSMKELVEQLLFLARGDNDSMHIEMTDFDLTEVAAQVLKETEMIDQTHPFAADWFSGPIPVHADMGLIKQCIRVLVDNSIKYTPAGGRITLKVGVGADGMARVSVQDEGQGIGAESLPHIFDRFYRTDQSRARQTGGTGLGLAIAKWIVDRHGGWFEVLSRQGVGTRMTMVLPMTSI